LGEEKIDTFEIMTMEECTEYLKTSLSTLYKLVQKGKIPAFKLSGQWRFKKDLIDEWIRQESMQENLDEASSLSHFIARRKSMDRKEKLRKTAEKCAWVLKDKYKARRIFLIGSLAKGFIHERSDIDLVVEGLSLDLYFKALTELWDLLPAGAELNLIPYEDAFESLKKKATEGELIYG